MLNENKDVDFVIVGAGPTGLVVSYLLLKHGFSVHLIERDPIVGGLSKTHRYFFDGAFHYFDTGPKRFHTDDPVVLQFLLDFEPLTEISRSTLVNFYGRFINWPIGMKDIFRLPPSLATKSLFDLYRKSNYGNENLSLFKNYIRLQYGNTLYKTFFQPYTEKFLCIPIDRVHSDWASTGINRSVIDSRVDSSSSLGLIKQLMLPKKVETKFLYPEKGGFGSFFEKVFEICKRDEHFSFSFSNTITRLESRHGFESNLLLKTDSGLEIRANKLAWSGNLNDLVGLLSNPKSGEFPLQSRPSAKIQQKLSYLNTAFFNLMVRESEVNLKKTAQWIYISGSKYKISRVTCMREFHNSTTPEGYYNLIAEVTSLDPKSQVITAPENLIPNVIDDLKSVGIVKRSAVFAKDSIRVEPVFDTYPIYDTNYKEKFTDAIKHIKSVSPHIDLLGRSGAFWYNNSDHSIRMAIEYVRRQVDKKHPEFLYREYFGGQPGH